MDCRELNQDLHAWIDGELDDDRSSELRDHADSCSECRDQAESARRLKTLIATKAKKRVAPAGLEDRVRELVAQEPIGRAPVWRRPMVWGSWAATLIFAVGAGMLFYGLQPETLVHADVVRSALKHHIEYVNGNASTQGIPCESMSPGDVCSKILECKASLPRFDMKTVSLKLAGRESFGSYQGAHLVYQAGKRRFSIFAIHDPQLEIEPGEKPSMIDGVICCCMKGEQFSVLCHRVNDTYICIVVNDCAQHFYDEILKDALALTRADSHK